MANPSVAENSSFKIEVSRDRLQASIRMEGRGGEYTPSPEEILEALPKANVQVTDSVRQRVEAFCAQLEGEEEIPDQFILAAGQPAKEGKDEEFVWDARFARTQQDADGDEPVDYYTFNSIITVEKDSPIGTITPLVPAQNGVGVFGETIRPTRQPTALELDDTVRRSAEDAAQIIANVAGRVVCARGRLSLDEVLEVRGDVDFSAGNVDSSIAVSIKGTVRDRFEVKSAKSVSIGGAIEAAHVRAGEDVIVRGGIVGRTEGKVTAGGEIGAKFCDEADLEANGDINIAKQIMNCKVHSESKLMSERGAVIGGCVYAREGGVIGTIGSDAYVPTRIGIGVHPRKIKKAEHINKEMRGKLETVEKNRTAVRPLMTNLKRLSPAQREQATELLFKADEAEAETRKDEKHRDELLSLGQETDGPKLLVNKTIHPGVMISVGPRAATIHEELKGPLVIEERKVENVTEIVAVNQLTGSVQVLPNTVIPVDQLLKGFEGAEETEEPAEGK